MTIYSMAKHYFKLGVLVFVLVALAGLAVGAGHAAPTHTQAHALTNGHS
jgi:hypothetical protein